MHVRLGWVSGQGSVSRTHRAPMCIGIGRELVRCYLGCCLTQIHQS